MKKLLYLLLPALLAAVTVPSMAQTCATGYCPGSITVHHVAGSISPVTQTTTYDVTKISNSNSSSGYTCMLNLGATQAYTSLADASPAAVGWFFFYNNPQGYYTSKSSSATSFTFASSITPTNIPTTNYITSSSPVTWSDANDPCKLMLGSPWRVGTGNDWKGRFTNTYSNGWDATLKFSSYQPVLMTTASTTYLVNGSAGAVAMPTSSTYYFTNCTTMSGVSRMILPLYFVKDLTPFGTTACSYTAWRGINNFYNTPTVSYIYTIGLSDYAGSNLFTEILYTSWSSLLQYNCINYMQALPVRCFRDM